MQTLVNQQRLNSVAMIFFAYIIYIVTALTLSLVICLAHRLATKRKFLTTAYIHQLSEQLSRQSTQKIVAITRSEKESLLEALHFVLAHSYGVDQKEICKIIYDNELDRFISSSTSRWHSAISRAKALLILSYLPHNYDISRFTYTLSSSDCVLRRAALLATLSSTPSTAISTIAKLRYELSSVDIAHIVALLRRNLIPIACEPLLKSENQNLILLGMALIRNFGITIADRELHAIIAEHTDHRIIHEAIYTLCLMHSTLRAERLERGIRAITPSARRSLCRFLSAEGYSIDTIEEVITPSEYTIAQRINLSHKRLLQTVSTI